MKISSEIPQYLPMFGHKAKIYYRGIKKMCTNCYQGGHYRKECQEKKVEWIDHVSTFINCNDHIPEEMFGRWFQLCLKRAQESSKPSEARKTIQPPAEPPRDEPKPEKESKKAEKKTTKSLPTKASSKKSKTDT